MKIKHTHPGKLLQNEFLKPLKISAYKLAKDIGVPLTRITNIIGGKRAISPETAILLGQYFNMSEQFFLNLQSHYDLEMAKEAMRAKHRPPVTPHQILYQFHPA